MKNCMGIFKKPFNNNPFLLSVADWPVKYLPTWLWSVPKYDNCKKNHCSDHGICQAQSQYNNSLNLSFSDRIKQNPFCLCEEDFKGDNHCSTCSDPSKTFPKCKDYSQSHKENISKAKTKKNLLNIYIKIIWFLL